MAENRGYTFELASFLRDAQHGDGDTTNVYDTAQRNGVDRDQLDRAAEILTHLAAAGEDTAAFIHREYLIDGWLHGYISVEQTDIPTSIAAQLAEAHYATTTR